VAIVGKGPDGSIGTTPAKQSTVDRYKVVWDLFRDFCFLIGDYESAMLPCRGLCPANPLSVNVDTAIAFLNFCCQEKGTFLLHHKTNQPVRDRKRNALRCRGNWTGHSTPGIFRGALSMLHKAYPNTRGTYSEMCNNCRALGPRKVCRGIGCIDHPGDPHYWRRGNPCQDPTFSEAVSAIDAYITDKYTVRRTYAFLPRELRDIRTHLISFNDPSKLMLWTIIILGVKLFLRVDEVLELTYEQFAMPYCIVNKDGVKSLCVKIKGKRDSTPQHLMIWDDEDCPDFSALRALLIWLALTGITSGKIFPPKPSLKQGPGYVDGGQDSLKYKTFLSAIKKLSKDVLKKDRNDPAEQYNIYGTHVLRKTAFLLAVWGILQRRNLVDQIDKGDIVLSARHSDVNSSLVYLNDVTVLRQMNEQHNPNDPANRVGSWQSIQVNTLSAAASLNLPSKEWLKPLVELANRYIVEQLKVKFSKDVSIIQICERAAEFKPPPTVEEEFEKLLRSVIPEALLPLVMSLLAKIKENYAAKFSNANQVDLCVHVDARDNKRRRQTDKEPPSTEATCKEKAKSITCSRDYQTEVRDGTKSKAEKLDLILAAVDEVRAQIAPNRSLDDPLRSWVYRAGKVAQCLESCFGGNKEEFLKESKSVAPSQFECSSKDKKVTHRVSFASSP
jgi:hypothetical protein